MVAFASVKRYGSVLVVAAIVAVVVASPISSDVEDAQFPLSNLLSSSLEGDFLVDSSILSALARFDDPVEALLALKPELEAMMAEPRLIRVFGDGSQDGIWMTEGDKLRLRREGKGFMDLTESQDQDWLGDSFVAGKPSKSRGACLRSQNRLLAHCDAFIRSTQHYTPSVHTTYIQGPEDVQHV